MEWIGVFDASLELVQTFFLFGVALLVSASMMVSTRAEAATANGTATATIVTPLSIVAAQNLAFGKIAASTGGTVVISAAGVRSKTGAVTLVSTGSTQSQALFNLTGDPNSTYSITLPVTATITSGANTMTVGTFTSNPPATGTLSANGTQTVNVGGTLTVASGQVAGSYTGTFVFTADYN